MQTSFRTCVAIPRFRLSQGNFSGPDDLFRPLTSPSGTMASDFDRSSPYEAISTSGSQPGSTSNPRVGYTEIFTLPRARNATGLVYDHRKSAGKQDNGSPALARQPYAQVDMTKKSVRRQVAFAADVDVSDAAPQVPCRTKAKVPSASRPYSKLVLLDGIRAATGYRTHLLSPPPPCLPVSP